MERAARRAQGKKADRFRPPYPIIMVLARDWNCFPRQETLKDHEYYVATGWIAGWLIEETEDHIAVALENFPERIEEPEAVRYVNVIPKETILFKRIIPQAGDEIKKE